MCPELQGFTGEPGPSGDRGRKGGKVSIKKKVCMNIMLFSGDPLFLHERFRCHRA